VKAVLTSLMVVFALFSIALAIADIRGGVLFMIAGAGIMAGLREAVE
jgi:hypothetical protein